MSGHHRSLVFVRSEIVCFMFRHRNDGFRQSCFVDLLLYRTGGFRLRYRLPHQPPVHNFPWRNQGLRIVYDPCLLRDSRIKHGSLIEKIHIVVSAYDDAVKEADSRLEKLLKTFSAVIQHYFKVHADLRVNLLPVVVRKLQGIEGQSHGHGH